MMHRLDRGGWGRWLWRLLACCALAAGPAQAGSSVTIAVIENGKAFEAVARNVLDEAYGRLGVRTVYKEVPALRALAESSEGMADGELQRIDGLGKRYPKLLQLRVPINWFDVVVLTKDVRFTPSGWDSLRPYTIGFHRGILALEQGTAGMKVDRAANNELVLRKLLGGRTDIALMPDVEARELLATMKAPSLQLLAPPIARVQLYHYLQVRHRALAGQLEAVLRAMEADGSIAAIRSRTLARAGLR